MDGTPVIVNINAIPAADAGSDQVVLDDGTGASEVTLVGSGSMEIFLIVVDFSVAKAALERELAGEEPKYSRIYRMT